MDQAFLGFEYEAECDNDVIGVEGFNGRLLRDCRPSCAEFAREARGAYWRCRSGNCQRLLRSSDSHFYCGHSIWTA